MTETPAIFVIALVKGAVEGDEYQHFGSLLGVGHYQRLAVEAGLITDRLGATKAGREFYDRHGLRDLPEGRAYLWPTDFPQLVSAKNALSATTAP